MDIFTQGLETERLYLVPVREQHIADIFKVFTPEVCKYTYPSAAKDISETEAFVRWSRKNMEAKQEILLVGESKEDRSFVGCFWLHNIDSKTPEPWLWVKESVRGEGLGREGILALIERGQANLDFDYMVYPVDKDNLPSRKIAELAAGIIEVDAQGEVIVKEEATTDPERFLHTVRYRIYKKS